LRRLYRGTPLRPSTGRRLFRGRLRRTVGQPDPALFRQACAEADYIPKLYNEKTGHELRMFYLGEATAKLRSLAGIQESLAM